MHAARRAELLSRSQAAWRAGDKALAKSLSDAGKAEGARVLEANARAADAYFTSNNKGRPVAEVDLHGLFADEAVVRIEERIKACRAAGQPHLVVIVGQGNHSKDGIPVLKPRIRNLMEQYGFSVVVDKPNRGCILVQFDGNRRWVDILNAACTIL